MFRFCRQSVSLEDLDIDESVVNEKRTLNSDSDDTLKQSVEGGTPVGTGVHGQSNTFAPCFAFVFSASRLCHFHCN